MSTGGGRRPGQIRCPLCLNMIDWSPGATLYRLNRSNQYEELRRGPREDDLAWANRVQHAYRLCGGAGDGAGGHGAAGDGRAEGLGPHYLPERFGEPGTEQIVVGVIGETASGKTHLVAAIVGRLTERTVMDRIGLRVDPLDMRIHQQYMADKVRGLLDRQEQLPPTPENAEIEFADAFLVENTRTGRRYALAFFDVAGERLARAGDDVAFVIAVNALLFVVDPDSIDGLGDQGGRTGDRTFDAVLSRLHALRRPVGQPYLMIPTALVVTKADRFRMQDPLVDRWMYYRADNELDLSTRRAESEDVHTFLMEHGGAQWLTPARDCVPNSMHFASATGCDYDKQRKHFRGRVEPRRVFKPLLSLFHMLGVLEGDHD